MKTGKKIKDVAFVEIKKDKSLDKLSGKVLFPDKLKQANKIIANLKIPDNL